MKKMILASVVLISANAFASFNVFQCTSKNIQITKSMPYKESIEYKDLLNDYPTEYLSIENQSWPVAGKTGDIEAFPFRRYSAEGSSLYSLAVTETKPNSEDATAILYRIHEDGIRNEIVEHHMKCEIE